MPSNKNFLIVFLLTILNPGLLLGQEQATVLTVEGKVLVDGKEISGNPKISAGSTIETVGGQLTLSTGKDNVMKLSSESRLRLEILSSGKLNTVLEKGRLEGIRRIQTQNAGTASTKVGTRSGTFEITGGRYLVEVPNKTESPVQFLAVDGNASITTAGGTSSKSEKLTMNVGEIVTIQQGSSTNLETSAVDLSRTLTSDSSVPLVSRQVASRAEMENAVNFSQSLMPPRTPNDFTLTAQGISAPPQNPILEPPPSLSRPNNLNPDPLQPVRPAHVTVTYHY